MELRQLRSLVVLSEVHFNVSRTAERLNLVQSAVTQHLKQLEAEVGTALFVRHGKRLIGLSPVGEQVLCHACEVLRQIGNITAVGQDHSNEHQGLLRIGATHTQARYVLPPVIRAFARAYPQVELQIHQGTPAQLADLALRDLVDLAVCTEALGEEVALQTVPCYRWNRALVAPLAHPLLEVCPLTLNALGRYPIITYVFGFTGRSAFSDAFAKAGVKPQIVLSAADTDVIKTYVRSELGVGIIASLAYQPSEDQDLGMRDLSPLFPWEVTKIAYSRDKYLRKYHQHFIDIFKASTQDLITERVLEPALAHA
ncbi:LysR substrate-binding domain-containing protein [Halochromatium glycolicum]|uniref:Transcriptional regulator CysB n=1 Tax=Halochromatium glycolicum TaxID=85075 RepID=A0AAJ0X9N1_9GAMM|nr:LysR substrate-binding domain-containing protein [Halochromatium glycolicum]MBK1704989.1 transcriptional regulator CysB [Halochromatium glycolicum]